MVKKVYLQIIGILLLLFVSGNIVATSIDVFAKSKYTYTELRYSEEIDEVDEVDDFEENLDESEFLGFYFLNYFSANSEITPVYFQSNFKAKKTSKLLFCFKNRSPKTPFFIQYKQLKISC